MFILGLVFFYLISDNWAANNNYPNCTLPEGKYVTFFPHKTNCSQFYKCSNGFAHLYNCSVGLHFNPNLNVCDWPQHANCSTSTNATRLPTTTSASVTLKSYDSPKQDPNCTLPDGKYVTFFPHKTNCSQFYKCWNGSARLYNCSIGLHFNADLNVCDWPQNVNCSIASNTTILPTSPSTSVSLKPDDNPNPVSRCPYSNNTNVTFLPHETNCTRFYKCSNGTAYLHNCWAGLHFNPILNVCDWPQYAGCNTSTNATILPSSTTTPKPTNNSTSQGPNCLYSDNTNVPHETNCTQFYKCSNGSAYLKSCWPGLHFNPILKVCDWPQNAGCNASSNATIILSSTTTQKPTNGSTSLGPLCPFPDDPYVAFIPHATNCYQFYKCSNGIAHLYDCPVGLHFNPVLNVCDSPKNAGCVSLTAV